MPPIRNSPNETIAAATPLLDIHHGSAQKTTVWCTRIQSTLSIVLYYSNWVPSKSLKTCRFKQPTVDVVVHMYEKHAIAHALTRSRIYICGVIPNPKSSPILPYVYCLAYVFHLFMKGVRLQFPFLKLVVSPPSFQAAGNVKQKS